MIATYINCITIIVGSLFGLLLHAKVRKDIREVIFISAGFIASLVGIKMALVTESYLVLLFSIGLGGAIGYLLDIEGRILRLGGVFERITKRIGGGRRTAAAGASETIAVSDERNFALGFLNASVLFCAGAMSVVGSIQAGADGNYELILIKSVMDGFMAIMFTAAYGIGVIFSAVSVLVYQGFFTLAAKWLSPVIGEAGLTGLTSAGGVLVIMIGINLLELRQLKTSNFLPALLLVPIFIALAPWAGGLLDTLIGV